MVWLLPPPGHDVNTEVTMSANVLPAPSLSPTATIARISGSRYGLELRGYLKPGWPGCLAGRLADQKISVLRGAGRKISAINWEARLELEMPPLLKMPEQLDYLAMICDPLPTAPLLPGIVLYKARVTPDERNAGSLLVELSGPDRLGFLASLLRVFSFYSLFPVEMEIETAGNLASNRFWLKRIGSLTPTADDHANLHGALSDMIQNSNR